MNCVGSDGDDAKSDKSGNEEEDETKGSGHDQEDGSTPAPEGKNEEEGADPKAGKNEEEEKRKQQHKTWQFRDAEYEAQIAALPLRTEPIGLDRHHRKYWLLTGTQDVKPSECICSAHRQNMHEFISVHLLPCLCGRRLLALTGTIIGTGCSQIYFFLVMHANGTHWP